MELIDYLRLPKRVEPGRRKIRLIHADDVLELEDQIETEDVLALGTPVR